MPLYCLIKILMPSVELSTSPTPMISTTAFFPSTGVTSRLTSGIRDCDFVLGRKNTKGTDYSHDDVSASQRPKVGRPCQYSSDLVFPRIRRQKVVVMTGQNQRVVEAALNRQRRKRFQHLPTWVRCQHIPCASNDFIATNCNRGPCVHTAEGNSAFHRDKT